MVVSNTPPKINMEPGNDGETNAGISFSKGPPFSGEPCLFWGGVLFIFTPKIGGNDPI